MFPLYALGNSGIVITEIMYDLPGADTGREWIKIFNTSNVSLDLTDWKFVDSSGSHGINSPPINGGQGSIVINAGQFAVLADKADLFLKDHPSFSDTVLDTVLRLKNSSDAISLTLPDGTVATSAYYTSTGGADGNGKTLMLNAAGAWQENPTVYATPLQDNSIKIVDYAKPPDTDDGIHAPHTASATDGAISGQSNSWPKEIAVFFGAGLLGSLGGLIIFMLRRFRP